MGKPTFRIGENKGADQLHRNCEANQRLCFRYMDSTIPLLLKSKISSFNSFSAVWFVSDLVGNPNCWFSHAKAKIRGQEIVINQRRNFQPPTAIINV